MTSTRATWLQKVKDTPSAMLLAVQLSAVLIYPFLEDSRPGRAIFSVIGIAVLGLAVLAVRRTPSVTWVSILLAAPALVLLAAQVFSQASWLTTWSAGFEAALYFYAAYALIRYMFADHVVTTDELFAVGATFTLLAWAFAYVYVVVQAVEPHSFIAAVDSDDPRTWIELLFLSFTTLSGVGLGHRTAPADGPRPRHDRGVLGRDVPRPGSVTVNCAVGDGTNASMKLAG